MGAAHSITLNMGMHRLFPALAHAAFHAIWLLKAVQAHVGITAGDIPNGKKIGVLTRSTYSMGKHSITSPSEMRESAVRPWYTYAK